MDAESHGFDVIVIGGGHAGAEAAWAAANLGARTALVTMDPSKIGAMSCNPAIGGLAKGQIVREIDALGGLMALATDATGIQFRVLNSSKGPAVRGPRAQCDKYRYAREVQRLLGTRQNLTILAGTVEELLTDGGKVTGVVVQASSLQVPSNAPVIFRARAVVLTTGTFMRGLMHTGPQQSVGGRIGEGSAVGISASLRNLGFELGRLKTGTPPRLAAESIDFASLPIQHGDDPPLPFSDLTPAVGSGTISPREGVSPRFRRAENGDRPRETGTDPFSGGAGGRRFPVLEQRPCYLTATNPAIHDLIRANLHRAPMYNGQIQTTGPRYCPSIEDKVVRFADRDEHHIYLEPESLETNEIYCNGISTSLPGDVQEQIVRHMRGCAQARILRYGYAVEYDMVWPHQIDATCMTKRIEGLFLAGQINGTSGYEEAAGQGLIAGLNAVRYLRGQALVTLRRDQAYIGVMLDDLVTKTPREPYRMFTSRAEYRLLLRADNVDERLTPLGRQWGLVDDERWQAYEQRMAVLKATRRYLDTHKVDGQKMSEWARRPEVTAEGLLARLDEPCRSGLARTVEPSHAPDPRLVSRLLADLQYAGYVERQQREVAKLAALEQTHLPASLDYDRVIGLRREARLALDKFRPTTLGQAGRLAGVTPADVMVISVAMGR
jgi:tRNA uridine 5-carboxymethylaminomethyl modification enzyme